MVQLNSIEHVSLLIAIFSAILVEHQPVTVTRQLADTPTRGLDDSRTGQLADATGDFVCLVFRCFGGICKIASCPVHDLSSPRVGVSTSCPVTPVTNGHWSIAHTDRHNG